MDHSQRKCFRALMQSACVVSLMLVALRGGAQSVESSSESASPTLVTPAQDHKAVVPIWGSWRSLTLSRVSPLNCETGVIPTTELTMRWRGQLGQAIPELAPEFLH